MPAPSSTPPRSRPVRLLLAVISAGALGLVSGCVREGSRPTVRPNVVVLELDACRADKVGAYGFERPTTPRLDALAADPDAALFEWQIVQAPHTKASTASLFTGVYPFQHGVVAIDDLTSVLKHGGFYNGRRVAADYQTIAETFTAAGYRSYANPHIAHLTEKAGFAQGFGTFLDPAIRENRGSDEEQVDRLLQFLAESDAPAFAYVHVIGCHNPFPDERRDPDYMARYGGGFDVAALAARGVAPERRQFKWAIRTGELQLDEEAVRFVHTVYEATLRRVDRVTVGRLVDGLKAAGSYDRTLLVVSADHGEELYDHGGYAHGATVWNEVVHVPLVVKFPRGGRPDLPRRVSRVTEAIDLYPSLANAAGIVPPAGLSGHDQFDPGAKPGIAYSQAPGSWSLIEWPWKLVVFEQPARAAIFDLAHDAHELHDLAAEHSRELRRLLALGESLQKVLPRVGGAQPESAQTIDPETVEELKSLGYLQ